MYLIDYHTHPLSHLEKRVRPFHNVKLLKEFVKKAENKGIKELGFSDHDQFIDDFNWENLLKIKRESKINIKLGLEIDFISEEKERIKKNINKYDFDYIIGSVHKINRWPVDHPDYIEGYKEWNLKKLYKEYFSIVEEMVKCNLFDIIGHIDLIKIFDNKIPKKDLNKIIKNLLVIIKEKNIAIEINTNGYNKPVNEFYPSDYILKKIIKMDIPIVFGSDAHTPDRVGENIKNVYNKLKKFDVKKIATFTKRKRSDVDVF